MFYQPAKFIVIALAIVFIGSGCSSQRLKEENSDLKQQMQQDQQTIQDYADKLRTTEKLSSEDSERYETELEAIRNDLNKALQENQILVKKLDDLTIIEMEHSILFASGDAGLSSEGKAIIKQISEAFNKYPGYHMRIEGHTDNMPLNAELKQHYYSNWELSAARAASMVRYMIYALNVPSEKLSIAGYADNRPVASNESKEGRSQNRRIRAVVFKNLD